MNNYAPVDCCGSGAAGCDVWGYPTFCEFNFNNKCTSLSDPVLSWNSIVDLINNKKPFAFVWRYTGEGGHQPGEEHSMVAIGYASGLDGNEIIYNDPAPIGTGDIWMVPYSEFAAMQGDHVHVRDYYDVFHDPKVQCSAIDCQ